MYEKIKERYEKGYVTDDQLNRYVSLGAISSQQAATIRGDESSSLFYSVPTSELDAAYKEGVNSYE